MILSSDNNTNVNDIWGTPITIHKRVLNNKIYKSLVCLLENLDIDVMNNYIENPSTFIMESSDYVNAGIITQRIVTEDGRISPVIIDITNILNESFKYKKKVMHHYSDDVLNDIIKLGYSLIGFSGNIRKDFNVSFLNKNKSLITMTIIGLSNESKYTMDNDGDIYEFYSDDTNEVTFNDSYISNVEMHINTSGYENKNLIISDVNRIIGYFSNNTISYYDVINKNEYINLITSTQRGYQLKQSKIDYGSSVFEELDLHYGDGFSDKYETLVERLRNTTKGLVLFRGIPGTGKTYCIQHMLKRLDNKLIIFVQPSMINNLTDPTFVGFLTDTAEQNKDMKENILLVVEEAESLLIDRDSGNSSSGISNLLNSTDGILNSTLKIQMILTLNTDKINIDKAVLREGRLIADFKFGYLSKSSIEGLCSKLNIEDKSVINDKKMTVSALYSKSENKQSIIFNSSDNEESSTVGFVL